jgi:hypothetical protein
MRIVIFLSNIDFVHLAPLLRDHRQALPVRRRFRGSSGAPAGGGGDLRDANCTKAATGEPRGMTQAQWARACTTHCAEQHASWVATCAAFFGWPLCRPWQGAVQLAAGSSHAHTCDCAWAGAVFHVGGTVPGSTRLASCCTQHAGRPERC